MTETILDKSTFNPDESSDWLWLVEETIALDKASSLPNGWHWFWVIYHLHNKNHIPNFGLEKIQGVMPYEHWQTAQQNEDDKEEERKQRARNSNPRGAIFTSETPTMRLRKKIKEWAKSVTIPNKITKIKIFSDSIHKTIDLSNFIFPVDADFSNTKFSENAYFTNAMFCDTVNFENAEFHGETANFRGASFEKEADFNKTIFNHYANFKGAKFGDRTIFQQAKFDFHAPRFYGAKFNNELILNRIDLPKATKDTLLKVKKTEAKKGDTKNDSYQKTIEENKSAYETLIYLMEKQNKHHDKQRFFREEMHWRQLGNKITRERRIADAPMKTRGCYLVWRKLRKKQFKKWQIENTLARKQRKDDLLEKKYSNYPKLQRIENNFIIAFFSVYDNVADYGNGIGRAFTWWLGHIAFGIGALIIMVFFSLLWECWQGWWEFTKDMLCSIPVSFANANPLTFIDFKDGGLMYCHDKLKNLSPFNFGMIKAIQIIVGIPLLFILLTTLRVRFRLGGATSNNKE